MKVLIIEDNDYKLDKAVRTLNELGIENYIHVNNFFEATRLCFRQKILDDIDFIILDIQFYESKPLIGAHNLPDQRAGYKFLSRLAAQNATIPVFIFSSVADYSKEYNEYLLPTFKDYLKLFVPSDVISTHNATISKKYEAMLERNKELLIKTNFVIGHAHDKYELHSLIKNYLDSNNQN